MKYFKTYLSFLGIALVFASCAKDELYNKETNNEELIDMVFTAGSKHPLSRTVLGADGETVTWQENDQIGIGYQYSANNVTRPFKTPTAGSDVHFWGKAEDVTSSYFMMYPYQENAKISYKTNLQAEYKFSFPKNQTATAGSFDPKANISVGVIPKRYEPFIAYNVGGLVRFTIKGTDKVKQVKLFAIGQDNLVGDIISTISFKTNGQINKMQTKITNGTPVVNLVAENGGLKEETPYYIALPEEKISKGISIIFTLDNGKSIIKKVKQEINIERAKVYDLGEIVLNPTSAKAFILKNKVLIDAVSEIVHGLERYGNGDMNIYEGENLEKILSFKGTLTIKKNDKLTTLDELQYYRNVTGLDVQENKNLAGEIDFNKYPQLTNYIVISYSPLVTKLDISGLKELKFLSAHHMNGLTEAKVGNNPKMTTLALYDDKLLTKIDASNGELTNINTLNSPKIQSIDTKLDSKLTQIEGLSDKNQLEKLVAWGNKIETYDFSKMTKLKSIELTGASVKEIKGLSAAGSNLTTLELGSTQISSLDVTQNTELQKLNLSYVKGITTLDLSNNTHLTELITNNSGIRELKLGSKNGLKNINVSSSKLSSLDISEAGTIENIAVGLQTDATEQNQQIKVTMTQQQKDYFDSKGIIFTENIIANTNDKNRPNSNVKVIIKQ